ALQMKGQTAEARKAQAEFETARKAVPADAIWLNNKAANVLELASLSLQARAGGGVAVWRKAVAVQDAVVYDEPPPWYQSRREPLGVALLKAGQAAEAEKVFRDDLDRFPRNGRSLFGLMKALEAQKKTVDAELVKVQFDRAWRHSQGGAPR